MTTFNWETIRAGTCTKIRLGTARERDREREGERRRESGWRGEGREGKRVNDRERKSTLFIKKTQPKIAAATLPERL